MRACGLEGLDMFPEAFGGAMESGDGASAGTLGTRCGSRCGPGPGWEGPPERKFGGDRTLSSLGRVGSLHR